jgi:hypothetical protein
LVSAANKHLRAANALLQLPAVSGKRRLTVKKQLASNKKMDIQLRFRSLRSKGRPRQVGLKKPNAAQVAAMQNLLEMKGRQTEFALTASESAGFMDETLCADVPYCVDTEDV